MEINEMAANAGEAASLLKSIANPTRLLVLCALVNREHTVGELEELVGLSQSALSQHLARLRVQELVSTRRDGQKIYYGLADNRIKKIIETLHELFCDQL